MAITIQGPSYFDKDRLQTTRIMRQFIFNAAQNGNLNQFQAGINHFRGNRPEDPIRLEIEFIAYVLLIARDNGHSHIPDWFFNVQTQSN